MAFYSRQIAKITEGLETGVAAETLRFDKLRRLSPPLLQRPARGRYGGAGQILRSPSRRAMKPYHAGTGFVRWSSFLGRASWPRVHAIAIAALLLLAIGASAAPAAPSSASAASTARVYLLRGVLNIFSLGLDDIAAQLRAQGIPVTGAHVHRKEPDHAAEGDQRDRCRRFRPIGTSLRSPEAAAGWSGKRGAIRDGEHCGGTPVARPARLRQSSKARVPQILPILRR